MKVEVTILESKYNVDDDDYNIIVIIAFKFDDDNPTTTSKAHKFIIEDEYENEEPLDQ